MVAVAGVVPAAVAVAVVVAGVVPAVAVAVVVAGRLQVPQYG